MKRTKRLLAIFLSVIMVASVMIIPASAATIATVNWAGAIAGFPELYNGSPQSGYIKFLQRFLMMYNDTTRDYIINSGGVDGGFGNGTADAVEVFQDDNELSLVDGRPGPQTWSRITIYLTQSGAYLYSGTNTEYSGEKIVFFTQNGSLVYMYTYDSYGGRISPYFHTIA